MHRFYCGLFSLSFAVISATAWSDTATIGASKDATMYADAPDSSSGGAPGFFVGGNAAGSPRRSLLAFDVAANVPAGSTITSAQLTLHVGRQSSSDPLAVSLRRLTADWGEGTATAGPTIAHNGSGATSSTGDATWNARIKPLAWTNPGALSDTAAAASATTSVPGTVDGPATWSSTATMVSDVQGWLSDPTTNFGWLLYTSAETTSHTTKAFYSRSATADELGGALDPTFLPAFSITYSAPVSPSGDYNGNGRVDAADYVAWRKSLNASVSAGSGADGNANGTIDQGDYTYWRARYGNVIAGAGISVNLPEASTAANLLLVIVGVGCQRSAWIKHGCRDSQTVKEM
jgi:hypothetical protein